MMHFFLDHFHGILLLSHKPLISHVKYTTAVVFVSAIFGVFFSLELINNQTGRKQRAEWSVPAPENVPYLLLLLTDGCWTLRSSIRVSDGTGERTLQNHNYFIRSLHAVTWVQEQLRKTKLENKEWKSTLEIIVSVAPCCFFTANFIHIALATGLFGLLFCAGFAFFTLSSNCSGTSTPVKFQRGWGWGWVHHCHSVGVSGPSSPDLNSFSGEFPKDQPSAPSMSQQLPWHGRPGFSTSLEPVKVKKDLKSERTGPFSFYPSPLLNCLLNFFGLFIKKGLGSSFPQLETLS